jgi:hypothetical protein
MDRKLIILGEMQLQTFRKLAVVGDIHGDYNSLKSMLSLVDLTNDGIIFLGDYADRGMYGAKVIDTVDVLAKEHPKNVFCLKGNHEDYPESGEPYWSPCELKEKEIPQARWTRYFRDKLQPFVRSLCLAVIVPDQFLFVHGGISSKIAELNDLKQPTEEVERDIIWSDPMEENGEYTDFWGRPKFGPDISKKVCHKIGVKTIIRSHEPNRVMEAGGPCYSHNGRVVTTSATTVYGSRYKPFVLSISPADFSIKCLRIDANPPVESEIVNCK